MVVAAVAGSMAYCQLKTTSSAVKGAPSCQVTPFFSFQMTDLPSAATPPFSRLGISPETTVVVYDDTDHAGAARLWFLLRWMGFENVRVLDGGKVHVVIGAGVATDQLQTLSFLGCGAGCNFADGTAFVIDGAAGAQYQFGAGGFTLNLPPAQAVPP